MFLNLCPLSLYLGHLENSVIKSIESRRSVFIKTKTKNEMNSSYKNIVCINNDRDNTPTIPHFAKPALYLQLIEDAGNNSNYKKMATTTITKMLTTTRQQLQQHQTERKITKIPILPTWSFSHT